MIMIPYLFYYQLVILGLLWLCVMMHYGWPNAVSRLVKIFKLAFLLEVTPLPSPTLRLVCRFTLIHTQRYYGRQRLRGS